MLITDDIFHAFLQCETKAHLKLTGAVGDQQAFPEWDRTRVEDYKQQCYRQWRTDFGEAACLAGVVCRKPRPQSVPSCDGLLGAYPEDAITPPRRGTVGGSWQDERQPLYTDSVCARRESHHAGQAPVSL